MTMDSHLDEIEALFRRDLREQILADNAEMPEDSPEEVFLWTWETAKCFFAMYGWDDVRIMDRMEVQVKEAWAAHKADLELQSEENHVSSPDENTASKYVQSPLKKRGTGPKTKTGNDFRANSRSSTPTNLAGYSTEPDDATHEGDQPPLPSQSQGASYHLSPSFTENTRAFPQNHSFSNTTINRRHRGLTLQIAGNDELLDLLKKEMLMNVAMKEMEIKKQQVQLRLKKEELEYKRKMWDLELQLFEQSLKDRATN